MIGKPRKPTPEETAWWEEESREDREIVEKILADIEIRTELLKHQRRWNPNQGPPKGQPVNTTSAEAQSSEYEWEQAEYAEYLDRLDKR